MDRGNYDTGRINYLNKKLLNKDMEFEFNYKTVYFFLLSLFGVIILLFLLHYINNSFALKYSLFGLILSLIIWLVDEQIIHKAEKITNSGFYHPRIDNLKIHKMLGYRLVAMWIYLGILIFIFLLSLIF